MTDINEIIGRALLELAMDIRVGDSVTEFGAAVVKALGEAGYEITPKPLQDEVKGPLVFSTKPMPKNTAPTLKFHRPKAQP